MYTTVRVLNPPRRTKISRLWQVIGGRCRGCVQLPVNAAAIVIPLLILTDIEDCILLFAAAVSSIQDDDD
jgi:hypothetical protein